MISGNGWGICLGAIQIIYVSITTICVLEVKLQLNMSCNISNFPHNIQEKRLLAGYIQVINPLETGDFC